MRDLVVKSSAHRLFREIKAVNGVNVIDYLCLGGELEGVDTTAGWEVGNMSCEGIGRDHSAGLGRIIEQCVDIFKALPGLTEGPENKVELVEDVFFHMVRVVDFRVEVRNLLRKEFLCTEARAPELAAEPLLIGELLRCCHCQVCESIVACLVCAESWVHGEWYAKAWVLKRHHVCVLKRLAKASSVRSV